MVNCLVEFRPNNGFVVHKMELKPWSQVQSSSQLMPQHELLPLSFAVSQFFPRPRFPSVPITIAFIYCQHKTNTCD